MSTNFPVSANINCFLFSDKVYVLNWKDCKWFIAQSICPDVESKSLSDIDESNTHPLAQTKDVKQNLYFKTEFRKMAYTADAPPSFLCWWVEWKKISERSLVLQGAASFPHNSRKARRKSWRKDLVGSGVIRTYTVWGGLVKCRLRKAQM